MTLSELPSTEDHIGVKQAITDNDQCEHLLETSKFNLALMYPSVSIFLFFFVDGSFQFSIEPPDSGSDPEELEQSFRYQIAICRIVNLDIRYLAADSATNESSSLVSPVESGCTQFSCRDSWTVGVGYTLPRPAFVHGVLSFPAMAPNYMNKVWLYIGHNLHEYSAADRPP